MTVYYQDEIWRVKATFPSITNGSREHLIVRPGHVLVVPAGKCRRVE